MMPLHGALWKVRSRHSVAAHMTGSADRHSGARHMGFVDEVIESRWGIVLLWTLDYSQIVIVINCNGCGRYYDLLTGDRRMPVAVRRLKTIPSSFHSIPG